mmetsp:Transcript_5029/g.17663  ORF Transcript_5029/g.17663 Transcript_5029/m.17663 type:complete len:326 (-) Transcript_5029:245-1222(-)
MFQPLVACSGAWAGSVSLSANHRHIAGRVFRLPKARKLMMDSAFVTWPSSSMHSIAMAKKEEVRGRGCKARALSRGALLVTAERKSSDRQSSDSPTPSLLTAAMHAEDVPGASGKACVREVKARARSPPPRRRKPATSRPSSSPESPPTAPATRSSTSATLDFGTSRSNAARSTLCWRGRPPESRATAARRPRAYFLEILRRGSEESSFGFDKADRATWKSFGPQHLSSRSPWHSRRSLRRPACSARSGSDRRRQRSRQWSMNSRRLRVASGGGGVAVLELVNIPKATRALAVDLSVFSPERAMMKFKGDSRACTSTCVVVVVVV